MPLLGRFNTENIEETREFTPELGCSGLARDRVLVEPMGVEPTTSALRTLRSPN